MSLLLASCRYSTVYRPLVNRIANSCVFKRENSVSLKSVLRNIRLTHSSSLLDANTKVIKDVLLYSNDSTSQIKVLNYFALAQFVFWNFLAESAFSTLKNVPVPENKSDGPWYTKFNFGSNTVRYTFTAVCLLLGNGLLATAYFYTIRAVKFVVLRKGGHTVSIITHSPIGKDRIITVPVSNVSANESRATARLTIPIQVKGKSLYYLLDMKGKFGNARLFDATVGLRRSFT